MTQPGRLTLSGDLSAEYRWLTDPYFTDYANTGCVTIVKGNDLTRTLEQLGANPKRSWAPFESTNGVGSVSATAIVDQGRSTRGIFLVEVTSIECSRMAVLERISRGTRVASVVWDGNGISLLSCANRGQIAISTELPVADLDVLPRGTMRRIAAVNHGHPDHVVGVRLAEAYTGLRLSQYSTDYHPTTFHPIEKPVPGLAIHESELQQLPAPLDVVVTAAKAADPSALRELAAWAVDVAANRTSITSMPGAAEALARVHRGPEFASQTDPVFEQSRVTARRMMRDSDLGALSYGGGSSAEADWGAIFWGLEAIVFASQRDSFTAAIGTTYCAHVLRHRHGASSHELISRALAVLQSGTSGR